MGVGLGTSYSGPSGQQAMELEVASPGLAFRIASVQTNLPARSSPLCAGLTVSTRSAWPIPRVTKRTGPGDRPSRGHAKLLVTSSQCTPISSPRSARNTLLQAVAAEPSTRRTTNPRIRLTTCGPDNAY